MVQAGIEGKKSQTTDDFGLVQGAVKQDGISCNDLFGIKVMLWE